MDTYQFVYVTLTGDLLVALYNDDKTQSKVVRYSEKQTIQFDDQGNPLYSDDYSIKCIKENRNRDICVADCQDGAVVVVNQGWKLIWRYTGHPSGANKNAFEPFGITTNSQSQVLTADYHKHCIHILDQDGQFLRYIEDVKYPVGLCVDQYKPGDVKVIRYLK